jgi:ATP-dependent DNA helicase RecQ
MPQKSKKPLKKANVRASSASAKRKPPAIKKPPTAIKRSASARTQPSAKRKGGLTKVTPAQSAQALRPKQARRPSAPKAAARAKPRARKPEPRAMHALILPPKPKRLAARLVVAPAPRAARVEAAPSDARQSIPVSAAASRATVKLANAELTTASLPASALRGRARVPRAAVTEETWQTIEGLATRLGRAPLNDEQRVAIRAALEGHDSVVVIADDERAVSCYQLAAFQLAQPTVVVSPVAADLNAQHAALSLRKLPVVCVSAELLGPERSAALVRIARGGALLVLLTPEALRAPDIRQALNKSGVALFVAEEAHCASDASHEWRPSFAELGTTLRELSSPPVMATTRIATAVVRRDIRERLGLTAPVTIQSPPVRENLQIVTKLARGEGRQAALVRLVERLTLPGLVYCATAHDVDSVYSALCGAGIAAHRHHSGMTASARAAELLQFTLPGQRSVMVAVSAFAPGSGLPGIGEQAEASLGFGRNSGKRGLRFVVHYQSPASIEQYLREIQLAGADGLPATCVLLHESSHRSLHEVMLAQQRFRATHLAELGRALETPALEGRTISVEALALGTGQSRRTTDRLTALLADAGVVSRASGWVRVLCTASELDDACRRLGAQLYALREQDARRLASVSAFAEAGECKLSCLNQYLGEGMSHDCGRCNTCVSELLLPSQESLMPQASTRRGAVLEFSVQPVSAPLSGVVPSGALPGHAPLTARLLDFGVAGNRPRE